jgi:hypothetical protein
MADATYMDGRKKYSRPQAILFSESPGELSGGVYAPPGYEAGNTDNSSENFIILSDHNRSSLDFGVERIEGRQRMVNGRMRSFWIADKRTLSVSWEMLPSRSFALRPDFNTTTGLPETLGTDYTIDGGAGGAELLDWYEKHYGTFYVFLAYDKFTEFGKNDDAYGHLAQYQEVLEMYITDFSWSVQKRGASNFDMWNCSITLEEA